MKRPGTSKSGRGKLLEEWQRKWKSSTKGEWTRRLIPSVPACVSRQHGETNYYLTQALTVHGCFGA